MSQQNPEANTRPLAAMPLAASILGCNAHVCDVRSCYSSKDAAAAPRSSSAVHPLGLDEGLHLLCQLLLVAVCSWHIVGGLGCNCKHITCYSSATCIHNASAPTSVHVPSSCPQLGKECSSNAAAYYGVVINAECTADLAAVLHTRTLSTWHLHAVDSPCASKTTL